MRRDKWDRDTDSNSFDNSYYKAVSRQVALELGLEPYKTKIHKNKKKYNRHEKHKNNKLL